MVGSKAPFGVGGGRSFPEDTIFKDVYVDEVGIGTPQGNILDGGYTLQLQEWPNFIIERLRNFVGGPHE